MNTNKKRVTTFERSNRLAMIAHCSDVTFMTFFWILHVTSGVQPWFYLIPALILGLGPVIAEFVLYAKDK